jgi:hypothetical protein
MGLLPNAIVDIEESSRNNRYGKLLLQKGTSFNFYRRQGAETALRGSVVDIQAGFFDGFIVCGKLSQMRLSRLLSPCLR